ncbi:FUSC family protein [Streptomyces sp. NPDC002431]
MRGRFSGRRAVRALVAFGLSVGTVTAVAGIHYGVFTAIGCYVDAYGARDPYPRRGPLLAALSMGFVVAFAVGGLAQGNAWAMVAVLSVVAVVSTLFVHALHPSGPGSYFVVLVAAMAAFLPPTGLTETAIQAGCLALGTAVSWVSGMSGWLTRPFRPEERAVSAAFRSVAAFVDRCGGTEQDAQRNGLSREFITAQRQACTAVHSAWAALDDARTGRRPGSPPARRMRLYAFMKRLEVVLDAAQSTGERGGSPMPAGPASRLRTAADEIGAGREPDLGRSGTEGPAAMRKAGRESSPGLPQPGQGPGPLPLPPHRSVAADLRHMLSRSSSAPTVALRVGLAVAVGTALGAVLPLLHPAWVAVGAAAVLQGGPGQQPAQRAEARFAGTLAGVGGTALVFHSYQPGTWATVAVAAAAHAITRALPPAALSVRTMLATPVALLLIDAASPTSGLGRLAAFRALDLTLGLALGVAAALFVRGVPRRRVCLSVSNAVAATGDALGEHLRTGAAGEAAAAAAWQRMTELWAMHAAVPAEEIRSTSTADRLWPAVLAVRRLLVWDRLSPPAPPAPEDGGRVDAFLRTLAGATHAHLPGTSGLRAAIPPRLETPHPHHHAELHTRLAALRSALEDPVPPRPARPPASP